MVKLSLFPKSPKKLIRKAASKDLDAIMDIVWRTIMLLQSEGNQQWSEDYPTRDDFVQDISEGTLYVCEVNKTVAGFICCNLTAPAEYASVVWTASGSPALFIHRFAVSTDLHRKGIGTALLQKAEAVAVSKECKSIRTDTCSLNLRMRALFTTNGYEKMGEVRFKGVPHVFYCFEKMI